MQNSAKQVEGMVRMKMEQREYIILCLEDTNDWSNATTRRLVMQVQLHNWFCLMHIIHTSISAQLGDLPHQNPHVRPTLTAVAVFGC